MIKKLAVKELELGMYVCGIDKAGSSDPEFFMNNILIRTEKDIEDFARGNHRCVYVDMKDPAPAQEAPVDAGDEFGSFQSIDPAVEKEEDAPFFDELTKDGETLESDVGTPDLTDYFEPASGLEPLPGAEPIELESFFNEEDSPGTKEPEAFIEPEPAVEPEIMATGPVMAEDGQDEPANEPEISTEPEAFAGPAPAQESEAIDGAELAEEPEAVAKPEAVAEAEPVEPEEPEELEEAIEEAECAGSDEPAEPAESKEVTSLAVSAPAPLRLVEKPAKEASSQKEVIDRVSFEEELKEAHKVRGEAESLVRDFMGRVSIDGDVMPDRVNHTVGRMVESVLRNQDALTSLSRLKSRDDYTFGHCVNVCILSLAIGRHMGFEEAQLNELGVGALLHDIGKMLVPEEILKKPGRLTDMEFNEMQKHASLGGELLYKTKEIPEASRTVANHHHERFDGTGYGDALSGDNIHIYARIGAVADVYDAMTSDRVYQKGIPPEVALRKMYQLKGTQFEPTAVDRMIKCLGIYPIGTLVELNTGEVAVVSMPNHSEPLKPKVMMLYDRSRRRLPSPIDINLATDLDRRITASRDPGPLAGLIDKLIA